MSQAVVRTREFGLHHALGVSVGAHALLVLLFVLFSGWRPEPQPVSVDQPVLQFTFKRDAPSESTEPPRGTVPDPTPLSTDQPAVVPDRQPSAAVPSSPSPPPSPVPQQPRSAQAPRATQDPGDDRNARNAEPTEQEPGLDSPARPDAEVARGETDPRRREAPPDARDLDLRGALQDYRRALERAKARRPSRSQSGSNQSVFVPDMSSMPVQGTPYGILEFSSRDYDWSDYYRQIYWDILKAWYRRMYATTADFEKWAYQNDQWILNHQTAISFVIHRSGNVSDIVLLTPSGCVPLDESAMDGLSEVILVPLPDDFPRDSELVRARFIANGEIANMRQYFAYLRQINFF